MAVCSLTSVLTIFFWIWLLRPRKQKQKKKKKWDYIKLKTFCTVKETISKTKRYLLNGRRYLQMIYPTKSKLIYKIYTHTTQHQKTNNPI